MSAKTVNRTNTATILKLKLASTLAMFPGAQQKSERSARCPRIAHVRAVLLHSPYNSSGYSTLAELIDNNTKKYLVKYTIPMGNYTVQSHSLQVRDGNMPLLPYQSGYYLLKCSMTIVQRGACLHSTQDIPGYPKTFPTWMPWSQVQHVPTLPRASRDIPGYPRMSLTWLTA